MFIVSISLVFDDSLISLFLFSSKLFNDAFSIEDYIASDGSMRDGDELGRISKELIVV
jgi:hypothetical protein